MAHDIAVIPGDGIGREVVPAAQRVLDAAASSRGVELRWHPVDWSCEHYLRAGEMMPSDGLDQLRMRDAIFLGAVGYPGVPDHISLWGLLIPIRRAFRQRVNYRPIRLFPGLESPLRGVGPDSLDFVVVRENNEGEYSEIGGRLYQGMDEEIAVQESVFTRRGVSLVMRYAFELARTRRGTLVSATKSNGIIHTMPFWDELFGELSAEYADVRTSAYHIDALSALFVSNPSSLDVVVASNLFGDILSDLGAAVAGSIGIAPSANLDPTRTHPSMFEPVHGSAPDIAGQGIANPIGQIWSGALMLEHLGHAQAATAVMDGLAAVLAQGAPRTPDLGGTGSTDEVTEAVIAALPQP
ncbi:MAG: tartrate dehydrogenase [Streptosporangiales bacterium]